MTKYKQLSTWKAQQSLEKQFNHNQLFDLLEANFIIPAAMYALRGFMGFDNRPKVITSGYALRNLSPGHNIIIKEFIT